MKKLQYEMVSNDDVFDAGIDVLAMGLSSDTIISIDVEFKEKNTNLFFDAETGEFAFPNVYNELFSDVLYELGEMLISYWDKYSTPDSFITDIDTVFESLNDDYKDALSEIE